jgi:hypothetical protein
MGLILPYYDKLGTSEGAFITPNGHILNVYNNEHEDFARRYCLGMNYDIHTGAVFGPPYPCAKDVWVHSEIQNMLKGKDIFESSSLTKDQLKKYKSWLKRFPTIDDSVYSDFLVFILAYDKVETIVRNQIQTTALQPHIRFFNYYLMGWTIKRYNGYFYDEKSDKLIERPNNYLVEDYEDREAEEEIEETRAKVLLKDIPYFFKQ